MTTSIVPTLYTKAGCPWCTQARQVLDAAKITYTEVEVRSDPVAFARMRELSGQTSAPVMDWNGEILADFGAEELRPFLAARGIAVPTA
jgi:glutaredoxin 3